MRIVGTIIEINWPPKLRQMFFFFFLGERNVLFFFVGFHLHSTITVYERKNSLIQQIPDKTNVQRCNSFIAFANKQFNAKYA